VVQVFDEMRPKVVEFGYVTMFSAALPLSSSALPSST